MVQLAVEYNPDPYIPIVISPNNWDFFIVIPVRMRDYSTKLRICCFCLLWDMVPYSLPLIWNALSLLSKMASYSSHRGCCSIVTIVWCECKERRLFLQMSPSAVKYIKLGLDLNLSYNTVCDYVVSFYVLVLYLFVCFY